MDKKSLTSRKRLSDTPPVKVKNKHAVALGKIGGRAGRGKSKARDPKKMSEAGIKGNQKRWGDVDKKNRRDSD